ncbi:MAG TPA: cell division ATP-binding protein FtsE [Alphaproteobacteria bacterium]|nr:cell division ATP-binding protein FtsE [Alphaproteobacteria bacterium]
MIKFEHVGLRYGVGPEILSDVNFTLDQGSFHFLSGPSGAGKTSLMSLMYLGRRPTRGIVSMFGQNVGQMGRHDLKKIRQRIGVVFQDFRLLNHMSAFDNIALPLRIMGESEKEIKANVDELMEWVGLGDHRHQLPNTMSGGQQQRIAIARAVITRPRLLLADEPTGNLDDEIGLRLMNLFDQLNRMGTTIVIASHNTLLMEKFSQHSRLILDKGQLRLIHPRKTIKQKLEGIF